MSTIELKMISHEFRDLVSRTCRSAPEHSQTELCHLLDFINDTPLLRNAVASAPRPPVDVDEALRRTQERGWRTIEPPADRRTELGFFHDLLSRVAALEEGQYTRVVLRYGGHRKLRDCVSAFMDDTAVRYAGHLRRIVTEALHRASDGESVRRVEVHAGTGSNPQLVIHQGQGNIHSVQVATRHAGDVLNAAGALLGAIADPEASTLRAEAREELREIALEAQQQAPLSKPSKWSLQAMKERLLVLASSAESVGKVHDATVSLASTIKALIGHLTP
jgi:hypothetical protein